MTSYNKNIAAIDIGTNSFHLIVVRTKDNGNFEIIDREKEVIRLGEGSTGDIKLINQSALERGITALSRFKGIADSHNAEIRAVATSAVREAHNKNEFIERVINETGIQIEIISGTEEARLINLGVLKAVSVFNKKSFIVDIGGGSTEFIVSQKGNILFSQSLKIGAVRLSHKFFPDNIVTNAQVNACRKWVEGEIFHVVEKIAQYKFQTAVGSSGTIMSTGLMIYAMRNGSVSPLSILNNFEFSKKELLKIESEILERKTIEKRKKIPGLDDKRADIIPAGIIILSTIFKMLDIDKMIISGYALREGIIIDTLQKLSSNQKPILHDIRNESIKHLAESSKYDKEHCKHVAKLALQVFDQLKKIHNLDDECREYLEAAALLHDIGYHISHTNHHHHTYYIIRNSELLGFNENEIAIIAHTARYHRKSHPKSSHNDFDLLPIKSKEIVRKLSAILRVADSFDRTHKKIIENVELVRHQSGGSRIENKNIKMKLKVKKNGNPEIELWSLERRKILFEEVFGKKLVVSTH
jgi:exopolyphosphatase/guanosine-5'-triphosphate,3'-diphosphate pyrophosphatase